MTRFSLLAGTKPEEEYQLDEAIAVLAPTNMTTNETFVGQSATRQKVGLFPVHSSTHASGPRMAVNSCVRDPAMCVSVCVCVCSCAYMCVHMLCVCSWLFLCGE